MSGTIVHKWIHCHLSLEYHSLSFLPPWKLRMHRDIIHILQEYGNFYILFKFSTWHHYDWSSIGTTYEYNEGCYLKFHLFMSLYNSVTSTSLMSLLLLYLETLGNGWSQFKSHSLLSISLLIYHGVLDVTLNISTTCSHAWYCYFCNCCHCCNVDFVLFHSVTCYHYKNPC